MSNTLSPIETQLINAIRANLPPRTLVYDYTQQPSASERWPTESFWHVGCTVENFQAPSYGDQSEDSEHFGLHSQVSFGEYRADLVLYGTGLVLVECDGHDWHERTKQQAAYDRARDRWFLAQGFVTARFTGSEIVNYPEMCCRDLFAIHKTVSRVHRALIRNGFGPDGRSFQELPSSGSVARVDGSTYLGHWNPGKGSD